MLKRSGGETVGRFQLSGSGDAAVTAIGERRTLQAPKGVFAGRFGNYDVHLYRIGN